MEHKKIDYAFKDGSVEVGVDSNQDGEKALSLNLKMSEAVAEAFSKGTAVEGVKVVDFAFTGSELLLKLDTDKDGEECLSLKLSLAEIADEVMAAVKKD